MKHLAYLVTGLALLAFIATIAFSTLATWTVDPDLAGRLAISAFGTGALVAVFGIGSVPLWSAVYEERISA